uniref:J domain-containing protein n=1 Tax=Angiostrongylus cantonensis TaxID=6313 RepID=A0A0K0DA22_ANGCA
MPPREESPYTTLGIANNSDEMTIKRAYRKLALKWHPDKHTEAKDKLLAEKQFKKIAQAYEILSDAKKREEFDRSENISTFRSRRGRKGDEFRSPFDIFREFFGDRDPFHDIFFDDAFTFPSDSFIFKINSMLTTMIKDSIPFFLHKSWIIYQKQSVTNFRIL